MNSYIRLDNIQKDNRVIRFCFSTSENLSKYFNDNELIIEYPESIESVPDSVAAVPFACCVLPIIWLTDSAFNLDELDESFCACIPEVIEGYKRMYPNVGFRGGLVVKKRVDNTYPDEGKSAMFYSGGLDSSQTLVAHYSEEPLLLSIWGSDIPCDNESGWTVLHSAIKNGAVQFGLKEYVIKSSFRKYDREHELSNDYSRLLKDNWWHGIKHSLALLGHVAPLAYIKGVSKMYIAASNCDKYPFETCASNPWVDNHVRFSGCKVIHDGYELSRQEKIHNLVQFSNAQKEYIKLHVCWITQTGNNCCRCEKCFRTMLGIWAEKDDPCNYGFSEFPETCIGFLDCFIAKVKNNYSPLRFYPEIQRIAIKNKRELKKSHYYKYLKWFLKVDFSDLNNVKMPFTYRFISKASRFRLYQFASSIMHRIRG